MIFFFSIVLKCIIIIIDELWFVCHIVPELHCFWFWICNAVWFFFFFFTLFCGVFSFQIFLLPLSNELSISILVSSSLFPLKVDDQMKLLQNSWSDMLVLDHLHHRLHNNLPDETPLHNGQKFDLLGLGLLGVPQLADHFNEIQNKLQELKFDVGDYICMKFLMLLHPGMFLIIFIIHLLSSSPSFLPLSSLTHL